MKPASIFLKIFFPANFLVQYAINWLRIFFIELFSVVNCIIYITLVFDSLYDFSLKYFSLLERIDSILYYYRHNIFFRHNF